MIAHNRKINISRIDKVFSLVRERKNKVQISKELDINIRTLNLWLMIGKNFWNSELDSTRSYQILCRNFSRIYDLAELMNLQEDHVQASS